MRYVVAPRRPGFTVLELIVSISIVSVLMAVVLAAVVRARDSARRVRCQNNLRQVTLASVAAAENGQRLPGSSGFYFTIYPFADADAVADAARSDASSPLDAVTPSPEWVVCPDDEMANRRLAANSYLMSNGVPQGFGDVTAAGVYRFGREGVAFNEITDGLSNTVFASERLQCPAFLPRRPEARLDPEFVASHAQRYHVWLDAYTSESGTLEEYAAACRNSPSGSSVNGEEPTWHPIDRDPFLSRLWHRCAIGFNQILPPNGASCYRGDRYAGRGIVPTVSGSLPATSRHAGLVMASSCDGAVRAIANEIDVSVWRALGSMSNGETIAAQH